MKKIIIVTQCSLPIPATKGGAVETLVESLINQNEITKKFNITIITSSDKKSIVESKKYKNTCFVYYNCNAFIDIIDKFYEILYTFITRKKHDNSKQYLKKILLIKKIKKVLRNNDYDKVIFENAGFLLKTLNDNSIANKYKNNIYYHLHNDIPNNIKINNLNDCKLLLISEYLKKNILKYYPTFDQTKIQILKNGVNMSIFSKKLSITEKEHLRAKYNIDKNTKPIVFVGRICKEKGVYELIKAIEDLNDYKLIIVGSHNFGDNTTSLFEQKIKEIVLNNKNKIIFTGFISHDDIWKIYNIAYICVLPSVWEEPAGLTMIESIACGTPLITTFSGGIPEYVTSSDAILLDLNDSLVKKIKDSIAYVDEHYEEIKNKTRRSSIKFKKIYNEEFFFNNFSKIMEED